MTTDTLSFSIRILTPGSKVRDNKTNTLSEGASGAVHVRKLGRVALIDRYQGSRTSSD